MSVKSPKAPPFAAPVAARWAQAPTLVIQQAYPQRRKCAQACGFVRVCG